MKKVIITGAMGFIGGHTAKVFKQAGYHVIGVDHKNTIPQSAQYMDQLFIDDFVKITAAAAEINNVDAIVHCAGTSLVGPSIKNPHLYFWNNSCKTNDLLEELHKINWRGKFIFSSSAAVYGTPKENRLLVETDSLGPISPYGKSKWICEEIIKDHCFAHGIKGIALRYFNACGCDEDGTLGHVIDDTHLIPRILSAYRQGQTFTLYGGDYNTDDGSCVRDYLHVTDIANAHLESVQLADSMNTGEFRAYNLGTGKGLSNKEIIWACNWAVRDKINFTVGPRREGDPDFLVADSTRFQTDTPWRPVNSDTNNIVVTAWLWERKHGS